MSDERKAYIASIVANGLSGEEKDRLETKRLLSLLREIDDDQVIILTSYLQRHWNDEEFCERHDAVLAPRYVSNMSNPQPSPHFHTIPNSPENDFSSLRNSA